jgi:hypothetical protein
MKNNNFYKCILAVFMFLILGQPANSQQLVQSFIERNITGSTGFAFSVSGAGDVNNDGYDDIIVGAFIYNSQAGRETGQRSDL